LLAPANIFFPWGVHCVFLGLVADELLRLLDQPVIDGQVRWHLIARLPHITPHK
jgi:hypothetical protein